MELGPQTKKKIRRAAEESGYTFIPMEPENDFYIFVKVENEFGEIQELTWDVLEESWIYLE